MTEQKYAKKMIAEYGAKQPSKVMQMLSTIWDGAIIMATASL